MNEPKDACRSDRAREQPVLAVGLEHHLLGPGLGLVVRVQGHIGVRQSLVDVDEVLLAVVDDPARRREHEFGHRGRLAAVEDHLGALDVDLFVHLGSETVHGGDRVDRDGRCRLKMEVGVQKGSGRGSNGRARAFVFQRETTRTLTMAAVTADESVMSPTKNVTFL